MRVEEEAGAFAFKKGDAPAVRVDIRCATPGLESAERETDVGRHVAVHAEELAHGLLFFGAHGRTFADLHLDLDDGLVAAQSEGGALFRRQCGNQVEHDLRILDRLAAD